MRFVDTHAVESRLLDHIECGGLADAVEWRKYGCDTACGREAESQDGVREGFVEFFVQDDNLSAANRRVKVGRGDFSGCTDAFDDPSIVRSDDLCAVVPVCFETVVAGRVVRRGDHDSDVARQLADCE